MCVFVCVCVCARSLGMCTHSGMIQYDLKSYHPDMPCEIFDTVRCIVLNYTTLPEQYLVSRTDH